jgi:hypothetical protein
VSLPSARGVNVLERLVDERAGPVLITVNNGSEFCSRRTDAWTYQQGVRLGNSNRFRSVGPPGCGRR